MKSNSARPETHLQHAQKEMQNLEKREAHLKAHKDMKVAAIEHKRIRAKKAEIARLQRETLGSRTGLLQIGRQSLFI
jgi:uncharacterized membrane protein (DUF106 family)